MVVRCGRGWRLRHKWFSLYNTNIKGDIKTIWACRRCPETKTVIYPAPRRP